MLFQKIKIIKSRRIYLKNFTKINLIKRYFDWFKDDSHLKFSRHKKKNYKYNHFLSYYLSMKEEKNLFFAIYTIKKDFFFGTITANIDYEKKSADIGILIGEKKFLKKSYGTVAWTATMNYLFKSYDIKEITGGAKTENKGMIKIFKKNKMKLHKSNFKKKTQIFFIKKNDFKI